MCLLLFLCCQLSSIDGQNGGAAVRSNTKIPDLKFERGEAFFKKGRFNSAAVYFSRSGADYLEMSHSKRYLEALFLEGICYEQQSNQEKLGVLADSLIYQSNVLEGTGSSFYADGMILKGRHHLSAGRYNEGFEHFEISLDIYQKTLIVNHPKIAMTYIDLGLACKFLGQFEQAMEYLTQAMEIAESDEKKNAYLIGLAQNNMARVHHSKGNFDLALKKFRSSLKIYEKIWPEDHPTLAKSHTNIGAIFIGKGELEEAVPHLTKALGIIRNAYGENHLMVGNILELLGMVHKRKGNFDTALDYYLRARRIFLVVLGAHHPDLGNINYNIGSVYTHKGEFEKAQLHQNQALQIWIGALGKDHPLVAYAYKGMGITNLNMNNPQRAIPLLEKAIGIWKNAYDNEYPKLVEAYNKLGQAYSRMKSYEKGLDNLQKSIQIGIQTLGGEHPSVLTVYSDLGGLYLDKGEYQLAVESIQKTLTVRKRTLGESHPSIVLDYINLIQSFLQLKKYKEAEATFEELLYVNTLSHSVQNLTQLPPLPRIKGKWEFLDMLESGSNLYFELAMVEPDRDKKNKYLHSSLHASSLAIDMIDSLRINSAISGDREFLTEINAGLHKRGISAAFQLYEQNLPHTWIANGFRISERARTNSLLEILRETQALHYSDIPDSLLADEISLKNDLTKIEEQYQQAIFENDSIQIIQYSNERFTLRQDYSHLIHQFEQNFPEYYRLKYDKTVASVEEIQKDLPLNMACIEYFESDSALYVFLITPTTLSMRKVKIDHEYINQLDLLKSRLINANTSQGMAINLAQYASGAHALFQAILQPELDSLPNDINRLLIIPHGRLMNLPFESLLTKPENEEQASYASLPWLLRDYSVQYARSATVYFRTTQRKGRANNQQVLAFAPEFGAKGESSPRAITLRDAAKGNFKSLPGAAKEVSLLSTLFTGKYFHGFNASEKNFVTNAGPYSLLHLATHAAADSANPNNSQLIFTPADTCDTLYDGILHAWEIYNLSLNADLAVLSACETGTGKIQEGEGMLSLSRAFNYAGCPAVVSSLWKAEDDATLKIMASFYHHLKEGMPKDLALQKAKLEYLAENDPYTSHPYFWAAFVGIGEVAPLVLKSNPPNAWGFLLSISMAIMMIGGISWGIRRRSR